MDLQYNPRVLAATGQSPDARFRAGLPPDQRRITDLDSFNALFLWRERRTVSKYGRIKLYGNQYPVSSVPHGTVVELRFDPYDLAALAIYDASGVLSRPPAPPGRSPLWCRTSPPSPPPSRRRYRPLPAPTSPACASSITPRCATAPRPRSLGSKPPLTTTTTRSTAMPMHDQVLLSSDFSRLPFGKHLQPADTFLSGAHQEALSRLSFGVADEDLLLLSGPIGCGKSVALAAFVAALDGNRYTPLYIRGSGLSASALVKAVLEGLKIDPPFFSGQASQLFFKTIPELNRKPVVIIDDAQDLAATALTAIKSMVNFHFDSRTAITFVLAGQPELRELLKYSAFAAVRQRIRISYHMPPLTLQETCSYIDHHTARCGRPASIFADDAKADIHRHAAGVPRLVNALCYRSILHAAANDISIIDSTNIVTDDLFD